MQISNFREELWPGSDVVARFTVDVNADIRLVGLKLRRRPDGSFRTTAPKVAGNAAWHLAPGLLDQISQAAGAVLNRQVPNDRN